jgi:hypothetical protein
MKNSSNATQETAMKTTKTLASVAAAAKGRGNLLGVLGVLCALSVLGDIDAPLAYWSFDDAEGLLVNQVTASPHHNASVLFGTPLSGIVDGASGIVGNALVLDGTAAIRLPYHQDNLGTSFTLTLWYWQQTNDTRQCVYQTRDNYTATYEAQAGANSTFLSYVGQEWAGAVTTGLREWIHLAHTFSTVGETTTLSLYTNGVFVFSKSVSSNAMFHANQVRGLHVGAYRLATGPADGRCFKGMIDELALWGRSLSAAEVAAVYQRGVGGWKLEFVAAPLPVISLAGKNLSYTLNADSGLPGGMFNNGWLVHGVQNPAYPYTAADTAGALFDYVPDTAGHAAGPFHAEIADVKWRVPMTEAMRQVPQGDYTLETWFRTTHRDRGTLMGNHSDAAPNGVVNLELHGTNNVRLYQRNLSAAVTDLNLLATNVNTRNGQWHHLAGIRRGSTMVLYVDGQEVGAAATSLGTYPLSGNYQYLGRDQRTAVAFNGELGTARVWMRALSTNELEGIVALGIPGGGAVSKDSLLAEYDLHAPFDAVKPGLGLPGYQIALTPPKFRQIPMTDFTLEAVFRTTATSYGSAVLMGNWSNNMYSAVNLQLEGANTVRFYMRNTAGTVASLSVVPANVNTRDGNWHRLAAVRRDNTMALYLDGQPVGSQAQMLGAYPLQGVYYYLGRDGRDLTSSRFYGGDLSQARIWTRALSADELAGLAASNAVPADGLLAQYAPMLTNSLVTAGFPGSRFLRSFTTRTNSATLVFADLPRHDKIGLGMLLAQLDQLEPVSGGDRFVIRVDGAEVLSVGLGPDQGAEPQVSTLSVLGVPTDVGVIKNTLTCGGEDLFFCGTAWNDYRDHVYDLALLEPLQSIPHTAGTLVVELLGIQDAVGENEGFGIDRLELTVYPRRGTLIAVK